MIKLLFNKIVKSLLFSAFSLLHVLHFSPFYPPHFPSLLSPPFSLPCLLHSPLPWRGSGGGSPFPSLVLFILPSLGGARGRFLF